MAMENFVLDLTIGKVRRTTQQSPAASATAAADTIATGDFHNYQHKKFSKRRRSSCSSACSSTSSSTLLTSDTAANCCVGGVHALQSTVHINCGTGGGDGDGGGVVTRSASYMAPPLLLNGHRARRYKYCAANGATGVAYFNETTGLYEFSMERGGVTTTTTSTAARTAGSIAQQQQSAPIDSDNSAKFKWRTPRDHVYASDESLANDIDVEQQYDDHHNTTDGVHRQRQRYRHRQLHASVGADRDGKSSSEHIDDGINDDDEKEFTGKPNSVKHMLYLIRRTQRRVSSI